MEVIDFNKQNSILNQFIAEIRDVNIQKDQMRFRRNLERIGEIMALEVSKKLNYVTKEVTTPLGSTTINVPEEDIVLGTVFRAGLPLHQGFHNYFDHCENAFVSALWLHPNWMARPLSWLTRCLLPVTVCIWHTAPCCLRELPPRYICAQS